MAKFVRVDIPVDKPDASIKAAKKAFKKHTNLGANSPMTGWVDMALFNNRTLEIETLRTTAEEKSDEAQAVYDQAKTLCGINKGQGKQTKGTMYWFVLQIRDVLKNKNRGVEENLQMWGFNVVTSQTGARKNIRIDIPDDKPENLLELGEDIAERHTTLGLASPLIDNVDMAVFEPMVTDARALVDNWDTLKGESQSIHNQAMVKMGYAAGQNSQTPNTMYFDFMSIRDRLLQNYMGTEEMLSEWGFNVVISEHSVGKKKGSSNPTVREGDLTSPGITNVIITGLLIAAATGLFLEAAGSGIRFYFTNVPGMPPGPSTMFIDVPPGQWVQVNAGQIGFSGVNIYLTAQNVGMTPGHYIITIG
ncbi:MAG: hypothetical protein V4615_08105 [Bacteroidota bacterium]